MVNTADRLYPSSILEHRCRKYTSGYVGHFIPDFKLELLNEWIGFIICTSYLTTEKVCHYSQTVPELLALLARTSTFYFSMATVHFVIRINGALTIKQRILSCRL